MRQPASLYGLFETCRKESARRVALTRAGADLVSEFEQGGWAETEQKPGLLVLDGPSPLLASEPHFHVYLPLSEAFDLISKREHSPQEAMEPLFTRAISIPWGLMSLIAHRNSIWLYPVHRHRPFLEALLPVWDAFQAVGDRYTAGANVGASLWSHANNVKGLLVRNGVPADALREPLDAAGLAAYVDQVP